MSPGAPVPAKPLVGPLGASGCYDGFGHVGLAEFTVTAEDGSTATHRVPSEEAAIGMMNVDGDFYATWFGSQETVFF